MRFRQARLAVVLVVLSFTALGSVAAAAMTPVRIHARSVIIPGRAHKAATEATPIDERGHLRLGPLSLGRAGSAALARSAAVKIPTVTSLPVLDATQNPNFNPLLAPGLDSFISEQNFPPAYGNLTFSIEPPDPALCVGNGRIVAMVQYVVQIFATTGAAISAPQDLFSFFGSPNITNGLNGVDSIGLARCYYDAPTNTFFLVATDRGNLRGGPRASALLVAVLPAAATSPAAIVTVMTTDDGKTTTIKHRHCPCFEDQPLIGADANGLYLSGNEFSLPSAKFFNGGQIYAINKADLVALNPDPGMVVFEAPNKLPDTPKDLDAAGSIVPAASTDGVFETANNGTEYFLSTIDLHNKSDNRIAVWAITNTCGVPGSGACAQTPSLTAALLASRAYARPPNAVQEKGLAPLGIFCGNNRPSRLVTFDSRMQQVVFAAGKLYSALTTALIVNQSKQAGLLYFIVTPSVTGGAVNGAISASDYVASAGIDLFYPAVAATQTGSAVMTFSMSGAKMFPSAGYIPLTMDLGLFKIHTAMMGAGAYDGESGYPGCSGFTTALWGFNAAAVAVDDTMWMATEYVSATCNLKTWNKDPTCGNTRGIGSNWGTLISNLVPPGGP